MTIGGENIPQLSRLGLANEQVADEAHDGADGGRE
jgi:hypothetical protein